MFATEAFQKIKKSKRILIMIEYEIFNQKDRWKIKTQMISASD